MLLIPYFETNKINNFVRFILKELLLSSLRNIRQRFNQSSCISLSLHIQYTGNPWVAMAIGTKISITKQCRYKMQYHMSILLNNSNPSSPGCCYNIKTVWVIKQEEAVAPDKEHGKYTSAMIRWEGTTGRCFWP